MATKNISVMIKPASSLCNLRCLYCFYADISENRNVASHGVMQEETLDTLVQRIGETLLPEGIAHISFQGGEPTVAGLSYFRMFVKKMAELPHVKVNYALQTNGTLINEEWAQFFKENNFLIGVSLDGFQTNMDQFRYDAQHKSVYYTILRNIDILEKYKVDYNILTVVTKELAGHAKGLFRFYKEHHFKYVQLIPCLPGLQDAKEPHALTPKEYAGFYNEFFDAWAAELRKGNYISVNLFDNLAEMAHGHMPYQCGMLGRCNVQFVVESNGDVYPCDFYCLDEYLLGNLHDQSFRQLAESAHAKDFLDHSACRKAPCESCRYVRMCNGGCRRQNICYLNDEMCAYQKVLDHVFPVLSRM